MEHSHRSNVCGGEQAGPSRSLLSTLVGGVAIAAFLLPAFTFAAPASTLESRVTKIEAQYGEYIDIAALLHDYDRDTILAVIMVESEGNPNAKSHVGARGLMQLMPGTAKLLGVSDITDPVENILGGTKYLKQLETQYGFDSTKEALVAYNMGPNRAKRFFASYEPEDSPYVRKVMGIRSQIVALGIPHGDASTTPTLLSSLLPSHQVEAVDGTVALATNSPDASLPAPRRDVVSE